MQAQTDKTQRWLFPLLLLLILVIAGGIRTFKMNWDEGTHLHPDERYLTMVASALEIPTPPADYWDTANSTLNPENRGYQGYVYGTMPLFAARVVGGWLDRACGETPLPAATLSRWLLMGTNAPCGMGTYTGYGGVHLVGRLLSTGADLLTLLALALLARLLYGDRVALLSAALYACAVLPIQHAHFFVVDSFATVFVIWTLYLAVYAVESSQRWPLLLAGLTTGLALASKVSVWPIAGIVGLAGLLARSVARSGDVVPRGSRGRRHAGLPACSRPQLERPQLDRPEIEQVARSVARSGDRPQLEPCPSAHYTFALSLPVALTLALSGILAFIAFRAGQPYAFSGPGFFDFKLSASWLDTMRYIRQLMSGAIDTPPGHQWANRAPIWFPWRNIVFWGLGLPLGLTAWIGWAVLGWRMIRRRSWVRLLPWVWTTIFFLYQGTQWVKSMRYFLSIYPVLVLCAAWILVKAAEWAARRERKNLPHRCFIWLLKSLPWLVLAGTVLWALAFLQVYAQPFTRVAASRWMFDHIPTAATVHTQEGLPIQVPLHPHTVLVAGGMPSTTPFTLQMTGELTQVTLNKVQRNGGDGPRRLRVALAADPDATQILAQSEITITLEGAAPLAATASFAPLAVDAGELLYLQVTLLAGEPLLLDTSVIGNEHWDDCLPLRIDGKDPFGNWYRGLSSSHNSLMNLYDNDTLEKRAQLLAWLDEVDTIALSSNRLYGSIPRLPQRFPLTVAYYRALFDGSLGFELAAEFVSFPVLGTCQFPDQEAPFDIPAARYTNARSCSVPYPLAEEAFSVYDHPTVLIFNKTSAYSHNNTAQILPLSLLENVQWMTPLQATRAGDDGPTLLLTEQDREAQEAGGTWSQIFKRAAWQNRSQPVAVFLWWAMLTALGWLAFPWLTLAFPALRDRGYGLARTAGLLLWAYPAWLLSALRLIPHTRWLLWGVFLAWGCATALLARSRREEFTTYIKANWRELLRIEALFAVLYLGWVIVRYLNPDFYHLVAGGEKPMDFAYLNAVLKSTWFPPYDPWFAGGIMNYYYFGFVLVGSVIKALGIAPGVAYNLTVPTLFALTGVGAYTLASNLAGGDARRARRAGLWGVALVLLLGNLGELQLLLKGLAEIGQVSFTSWIPGYEMLVSAAVGLWKMLFKDASLSFRPEWWYWNATRIIPPGPGEVAGPINEFPLFTFLYADLHAHAMALPLTQVALGVALQWGLRKDSAPRPATGKWGRLRAWLPQSWATFLLGALVAGALRATNTWDYPTYLGLMALGYLLPLLQAYTASDDEMPAPRPFPYRQLLVPVALFVLAELLFRPYSVHYVTVYTRLNLWEGRKTPLGAYFLVHGHLLIPLAILALAQGRAMLRRMLQGDGLRALGLPLAVVLIASLLLTLTLLNFGVVMAWVAIPLGMLVALLLLDPEQSPRFRLLWLWVGSALALTVLVEVVVLAGDIGRMNTVFKFYFQVWMLLALSAAVAMERLWSYLWNSREDGDEQLAQLLPRKNYVLNDVLLALLAILLFATALYPLLAIPAKTHDRWAKDAPHTLDGTASLPYVTLYEYGQSIPLATDTHVIHWLQENVPGSPTIMEANAAVEYITWGNRMSIYTGLPGVVGWRWHQVQQRMVMSDGTVEYRQSDVKAFYDTSEPDLAWKILQRYHVQYVILTPYERAYMAPLGAAKFDEMVRRGWLEIVYEEEDAVVYRVGKR